MIDDIGGSAIMSVADEIKLSVDFSISFFSPAKINDEVGIGANIVEGKGKLTSASLWRSAGGGCRSCLRSIVANFNSPKPALSEPLFTASQKKFLANPLACVKAEHVPIPPSPNSLSLVRRRRSVGDDLRQRRCWR